MSPAAVASLPPRPRRPVRHEPVAVLDIGTSKVCCAIARPGPSGELEPLGVGYQLAEGLRAGEIVEVDAVEASILAVVHEAEQQAGMTLREVLVGISGARPRSRTIEVELDLGGRPVVDQDLQQALAHARAEAHEPGTEILHVLPTGVTLDDSQPLRDPRGMVGRRLRIRVHVVQVAEGPLAALVHVVERCHLDVGGVLTAAYAAGLGVLTTDEALLGCLVLDLGAGVTGTARFGDGRLQDVQSVPLGGRHITRDLAFGLGTGSEQAERLKALFGDVLPREGNARRLIEVATLGNPREPSHQVVTKAHLTDIIRPRVEEIFQLVLARLALDPGSPTVGRLVLTGGGAQLEGMVELAEEVFGVPARLGRAGGLMGRDSPMDLTAASTAAGLLVWATRDDGGLCYRASRPAPVFGTRLQRLGQWLKENF